jgi:hypothetical protein
MKTARKMLSGLHSLSSVYNADGLPEIEMSSQLQAPCKEHPVSTGQLVSMQWARKNPLPY